MPKNSIENYKELVSYLENLKNEFAEKPTLLLHSCCAPCSSHTIDFLSQYFSLTIFYSNDNIYPREEYEHRLDEQKKFVGEYNKDIKLLYDDYNSKDFYSAIKGLENFKEGGERCYECYLMRLEKTAKKAKELNFDYFTTTLSISPYKHAEKINAIGYRLQEKHNVKFLYSNFKKNDGYKKSIQFSREYGLYRQDYCGCVFSLHDSKQKPSHVSS